ncbi:MAG: hypothetical protein IH597_10240 [Bacteroidales bacterium]|nr:hypothetical protein [Bacteroidales bacterium]
MNYKQVCSDCGSEEVARCKWVNVNTDHIYDADSGTVLEWCFNCNEQTTIVEKPGQLQKEPLKENVL